MFPRRMIREWHFRQRKQTKASSRITDSKGKCSWEGKKIQQKAMEVGRGQMVKVITHAKLKSLNFMQQRLRSL